MAPKDLVNNPISGRLLSRVGGDSINWMPSSHLIYNICRISYPLFYQAPNPYKVYQQTRLLTGDLIHRCRYDCSYKYDATLCSRSCRYPSMWVTLATLASLTWRYRRT